MHFKEGVEDRVYTRDLGCEPSVWRGMSAGIGFRGCRGWQRLTRRP